MKESALVGFETQVADCKFTFKASISSYCFVDRRDLGEIRIGTAPYNGAFAKSESKIARDELTDQISADFG